MFVVCGCRYVISGSGTVSNVARKMLFELSATIQWNADFVKQGPRSEERGGSERNL